jgi:LEA14-like dessication related protein
MRSPLLVAFALVLVAASFVVACSKPEPPVITPKEASVTAITGTGVDLRASLEAYNPNRIALDARTVTAKMVLDGKYDLGTVTIPHAIALPAGARVTLDVPVSIKWNDFAPLLTLAASNHDVPYEITGTVNVGGEKINFDLPFSVKGTMTHAQIVQATMRSIPQIPGMPMLPSGLVPGMPLPPAAR